MERKMGGFQDSKFDDTAHGESRGKNTEQNRELELRLKLKGGVGQLGKRVGKQNAIAG